MSLDQIPKSVFDEACLIRLEPLDITFCGSAKCRTFCLCLNV